ncbi:hypothetical protein E0L36_10885 [Streptomyces sp. AJS327]|uniref:hypothetical protein n=1 Tax=Streptomyces sp. AJS327 TaxID=2545265 RepID=UPI0015E00BC2|nr:hypothetical protein [Streptomyces sp. AJS327]MBA0051375.1 hypothetical protein [Streptomyces sp. AJS327]
MDTWVVTGLGAAYVLTVMAFILVRRAQGSTREPLPTLDRVPRTATVVGGRAVPRRRAGSGSGDLGEPGDLGMVEVEYTDGAGAARREYLADLFTGPARERLTLGSTWRVLGFAKPRGRCLLAEEHDALPRSGYDLDGLRVRSERQEFAPRTGSPVLGVMSFANDATRGIQPVRGARTSWPGDPASAWEEARGAAPLERPRPVPPLADVPRPDDSLPAASSSDRRREPEVPEAASPVLCEVYASPLTIPGGDSESTTRILVDVRTPDERAARVAEALRIWAGRPGATDAWGQEPGWLMYRALTSAELFGEDAAGAFLARDCPAKPGGWLLVTPSPSWEPEYPDAPYRRAGLTRVALPKGRTRGRAVR